LGRQEVEDGPDRRGPPISECMRERKDGVGRRELLGRGGVRSWAAAEKNRT
jgi:hypothetical protein